MAAYNNDDVIRFVEDDMLPEEKRRFAAAMAEDAELFAAVGEYRLLKETLEKRLPPDPAAVKLREQLQQQRSTYFGGQKPKKIFSIKTYLWGISAAAAIIIAVVLLRHTGETDYVATYGNIEMQVSAERGSNQDSLLQSAALYFNEHAYTKVVPLLDKYLASDTASQTARFYRGIALLRTNDNAKGLADLQQVYEGESVFKYDAAFYTALYHVQQHQHKMALEWLEKIPADAAIAAKAAALKKDLK